MATGRERTKTLNFMPFVIFRVVEFVCTAILAWLLIFVVRFWAERRNVLDIPNDRSSHSEPVPRGGGLAIVAVCLAGWWCAPLFSTVQDWRGTACYGVGAALIAAVSWLDDLQSLSRRVRFVVHSFAAILLILGFGAWNTVSLPLVGDFSLAWVGCLVAFLWIVGLTNAYNFMDGIDGIAASQAVIAGLGWIILGRASEPWTLGMLGLLVSAGSAGFLIHNWPPARIFMGDVGSAFLGYTFAFLALAAGSENSRLCLAGILLVWPFIFDSGLTFVRRLLERENVFAAHRTHLYQRLVIAGWSHAAVTLLYVGLDLAGLLLAILYANGATAADWLILAGLPAMALGLWSLVVWQERKHCPAT